MEDLETNTEAEMPHKMFVNMVKRGCVGIHEHKAFNFNDGGIIMICTQIVLQH